MKRPAMDAQREGPKRQKSSDDLQGLALALKEWVWPGSSIVRDAPSP